MQVIKNMRSLIAILSCIFILFSCSEYSKIVKKGTNDQKIEMAKKMYKKRDYERALTLYEDLLATYRGKKESEEIYYYYCYCYYGLKQYEMASYHFKNFTENYYNSKHLREFSYMYAYSLYKNALPYYLDQTTTYEAITEMQGFLNKYPNDTTYREKGNQVIDELRNKLKQKAYDNAMLYLKIEDYKAAIVSFKNALKDFPDISKRSEIEYNIIKSYYFYAKNSVEDKKEERYNELFKEYSNYIKIHKIGEKYYQQATDYYNKGKIDLENILNRNKS